LTDVQAARPRITEHLSSTPCRASHTLSELTGTQIYLKFENLRFTASFKERGALDRCCSSRRQSGAAGYVPCRTAI